LWWLRKAPSLPKKSDTWKVTPIGSPQLKQDTPKRKMKTLKSLSLPQETEPFSSGNSITNPKPPQTSESPFNHSPDTLTSSATLLLRMTTTIFSPHLGIELLDSGIWELERLPKDSLKMGIAKKSSPALSPQTEDTFCHQDQTERSSSGTLRVTVNTPSKSTTTTTGSQKSDLSLPHQRLQLEDNTSHPSDGTDTSRSGTTKPSTLKTALECTTEASMPSLSPPEETSLLLEEKTRKLEFSISVMLKSLLQAMMLDHQSTALLSIQDATGSPLVLKLDGKFGTSKPRTPLSLLKETSNLKERRAFKRNSQRRPKLTNSTKWPQSPGTPSETDFSLVSATVTLKSLKLLNKKLTDDSM